MTTPATPAPPTSDAALAADAFLYGFPLVFDLQEVGRFTREGLGSVPPTPFNIFGHAPRLAGPDERFVSINNDTVYSIANVDLSGGPVRLDVPDAGGRYYVLQLVDAWTNNFAYVGHRATGTGAGSFLLVPPRWDGTAQNGARVIRVPTAVASIVGRWAVDGEADVPAVRTLQAGLALTPLGGPGAGLPEPEPGVPEDLLSFELMRVWMRAFPPAARDRAYQERFAAIGLLDATSPYRDPDAGLADALRGGLAAGHERLEAALTAGGAGEPGGWSRSYHTFDYNLDFFEVGALDDPGWRMEDTEARYLLRAAAARGGLWGNNAYEAAYAFVYADADGRPLDGGGRYELRLEQDPPVGAFWSVTMYDAPDFFLVANPIDRYSIGDRTPGLRRDPDGSLTIVIQRDAPEDTAARANWLPAPAGPFRPIMRMYEPGPEILDGRYRLPPIVRIA